MHYLHSAQLQIERGRRHVAQPRGKGRPVAANRPTTQKRSKIARRRFRGLPPPLHTFPTLRPTSPIGGGIRGGISVSVRAGGKGVGAGGERVRAGGKGVGAGSDGDIKLDVLL
jgi:hypothetical protein